MLDALHSWTPLPALSAMSVNNGRRRSPSGGSTGSSSTLSAASCSSPTPQESFDALLTSPLLLARQLSARCGRRVNTARYKTELCRSFQETGSCKYGDKCQFAHGLQDLRSVPRHPKYKTDMCKTFHSSGFCPYGPRCHFVHSEPQEQLEVMRRRAGSMLPRSLAPGALPALLIERQVQLQQLVMAQQRERAARHQLVALAEEARRSRGELDVLVTALAKLGTGGTTVPDHVSGSGLQVPGGGRNGLGAMLHDGSFDLGSTLGESPCKVASFMSSPEARKITKSSGPVSHMSEPLCPAAWSDGLAAARSLPCRF